MIKTAPSLTGFMRTEVKRLKEQNQSGANDYSSQGTIIQEDEAVNHGYSEEVMSGSGQQLQPQTNDDDDIGSGGGLPMRLPTEIMNSPPPEITENEYTETNQQNDNEQQQDEEEETFNDITDNNETEQVIKQEEENENNEKVMSLESEYAMLDLEMAQQFYYLTSEQYKMGPFTMEQITEKYKSKDVNDDTLIWSGNETHSDAKPLKENERIYSNLPRPPKRRQPQQKQVDNEEYHEVVSSRSPSPEPKTEIDSKPPVKSSGGCCIVL